MLGKDVKFFVWEYQGELSSWQIPFLLIFTTLPLPEETADASRGVSDFA